MTAVAHTVSGSYTGVASGAPAVGSSESLEARVQQKAPARPCRHYVERVPVAAESPALQHCALAGHLCSGASIVGLVMNGSPSAHYRGLISQAKTLCLQNNTLVLVLEYCCTDLAEVIQHSWHPLSEEVLKSLFQQILTGLAACHEAGVCLTSRALDISAGDTGFGLVQESCTEMSNLQTYCCHKMVSSSLQTLGMPDPTMGETGPSTVTL